MFWLNLVLDSAHKVAWHCSGLGVCRAARGERVGVFGISWLNNSLDGGEESCNTIRYFGARGRK